MQSPGKIGLLLLWLALFFLTPLAQAHEGHERQRNGVQNERVAASPLATPGQPCGGGGNGHTCCCNNACCVSPDGAKVPAAAPTRSVLTPPDQRPRPVVQANQIPWLIPLIIALSAPRAPPVRP